MKDTTEDVAATLRLMYQSRTPDERVRMACGLFDTARALATAGIRLETPGISDVDLRIALFERFYGRDVDARAHAAIIARIRERR